LPSQQKNEKQIGQCDPVFFQFLILSHLTFSEKGNRISAQFFCKNFVFVLATTPSQLSSIPTQNTIITTKSAKSMAHQATQIS
jgi:hypothetical protein